MDNSPKYTFEELPSSRLLGGRTDLYPVPITTYSSELQVIAAECFNKPGVEVGGALMGLVDRNQGLVVMLATGPGDEKNSFHSRLNFHMDIPFLKKTTKFLYENFALVYLGNWHCHLISLFEPSPGDINSAQRVARKNNHKYSTQFILTFRKTKSGESVEVNPYIYLNEHGGMPKACLLKVLPGVSPIRLALQASGQFPELVNGKFAFDDRYSFILPASKSQDLAPISQTLQKDEVIDKNLEQQLLQLPEEVLSGVEIEVNEDTVLVTIPAADSNDFLYLVYNKTNQFKVHQVFFSHANLPCVKVDLTCNNFGFFRLLRFHFWPHAQVFTIWLWFVDHVGRNHCITEVEV